MSYNKEQFEKNYSLAIDGIVNALNLIRKGNKSAPYRIENILNMIDISKEALEEEIKTDIILKRRFERFDEYKREAENLLKKT